MIEKIHSDIGQQKYKTQVPNPMLAYPDADYADPH